MIDTPDVAPAGPAPRVRKRRVSAQTTRERRRRLVTWGLSLTIGVLLINAFVGEDGYLASVAAAREEADLRGQVATIRYDNADLQQRRILLDKDPAAVEEAARKQLNFIHPGETLIIVQPPAPAPAPDGSR
jgi:cell division protein FtsB